MFLNIHRYMEMKYGPKKENIEVDQTEFIRLLVEQGMAEEDAKFQANMSKNLGSSLLICDKMVKIK